MSKWPGAALLIGLAGGSICYVFVQLIKHRFLIDDSLDVFAVHGVGGATGIILTAFFVDETVGGAGLPEGVSAFGQFGVQVVGLVATVAWSIALSFVIVKVVQAVVGLRVSDEDEIKGLDVTAHGETGYNM